MGSEIAVRLEKNWASFTDGEHHYGVEPLVFVATGSGPFRVVGVGRLTISEPTLRIAIFDPMPVEPAQLKAQCLDAFFAHGLQQLSGNKMFSLKPTVRVHGAGQLAVSFAGFQEILLERSLLAAGARSVIFSEF